jgi:hypothetical protein
MYLIHYPLLAKWDNHFPLNVTLTSQKGKCYLTPVKKSALKTTITLAVSGYIGIWRSKIEVKQQQQSHVHSVQQKSSGLIFRTSRSDSHGTYSCHHNSSRFSFPIFVNSWHFYVFHSLQSIAPRIYLPKTPIHSLNLKLKHELKVINFPRHVAC